MRQSHELSLAESQTTNRRPERRNRIASVDGKQRSGRTWRNENGRSGSGATRTGKYFFDKRGGARRLGRALVARSVGGRTLRVANPVEKSGLHGGGGVDAGAGNWSEHGCFFRCKCGVAPAVALSGFKSIGDGLGKGSSVVLPQRRKQSFAGQLC